MKAGGYREKRKGVYEFRVRLVDPITGQQIRRSHTWRGTKRNVGGALAEWVADQRRTVDIKPAEQTLSWLVDRWLDIQAPVLGADTVKTYRSYKKTWIDTGIGQYGYADITAGHLRELHSTMTAAGKAPSTIHQVHAIIRGSLTYATERFGLAQNVAAVRKAPKVGASDVVAPTDAELETLLLEAGDPGSDLWTAIALGATLGRRLGQLCTIQLSDIDLDGMTVAMRPTRKSPKRVALPIDVTTASVLRTRLEWQQRRWEQVFGGPHPKELVDDPFLLSFVSDGREPNPDSYTGGFSRLRNKLGYGHLHFHCLRHWCATTLINLGTPLPVVAQRLGHSSPAVTARIYAHVIAGKDAEAAVAIGKALPLERKKNDAKVLQKTSENFPISLDKFA